MTCLKGHHCLSSLVIEKSCISTCYIKASIKSRNCTTWKLIQVPSKHFILPAVRRYHKSTEYTKIKLWEESLTKTWADSLQHSSLKYWQPKYFHYQNSLCLVTDRQRWHDCLCIIMLLLSLNIILLSPDTIKLWKQCWWETMESLSQHNHLFHCSCSIVVSHNFHTYETH